jgi:hypothetical protein
MKFMITFNHIEGAWEGLNDEQRQSHTQWLGEFVHDLKQEKNADLIFVAPPDQTRTVRKHADASMEIAEGPAFPGPEFLGGYYVIEAENLEEAIRWAERGRTLIGSNEVRQIMDFTL